MIKQEPLVIETTPTDGLLEALEMANEMLETVTEGVNNYLENIRLYFSRFFFLSNDEMLEILSETKDPLRVQPHLNKCFEGIWRLEFDENLEILSMLSSDREQLNFHRKVITAAAKGRVEKWLLEVQEQMLLAVQMQINASYTNYQNEKRNVWVLKWPQMVVLCISQVFWTSECHSCLRTSSQNLLKQFYQTLQSNLNDIVAVIRSKDITNLNRITIKSLIVIDVHAKDVVEKFIADNVASETDFQWLAQLRYYWSEGSILVRVINATVPFANEYLGNSDRLVITPLTDRCYRTLICAYQLHLNGAPEGPAGTGKTETTKDLAKALAVQCKVSSFAYCFRTASVCTLSFLRYSIVRMAWITKRWENFSKDLHHPVHGHVLMNSIVLNWKYYRLLHNKYYASLLQFDHRLINFYLRVPN